MKKIQFSSNTKFSTPLPAEALEQILGGAPSQNQGSGDWMDSTSELASGGTTTDTYEDGFSSGAYTAGSVVGEDPGPPVLPPTLPPPSNG